MKSVKITLSVPQQILEKLKLEQKKYAYTSVQEVIIDSLRYKYFYQVSSIKETRGRPKKIREEKILARKKIFSKKGEPISL